VGVSWWLYKAEEHIEGGIGAERGGAIIFLLTQSAVEKAESRASD